MENWGMKKWENETKKFWVIKKFLLLVVGLLILAEWHQSPKWLVKKWVLANDSKAVLKSDEMEEGPFVVNSGYNC
ncbi:hypothetical protein ACSQ67_008962 [Phaseolus vulgaris]